MSNIEDDVKILEKFKNNEMQRDKLERDNRCGGWKIGDIYKHLELNTAIQNILAEREQKDKRIKELEEYIAIAPNLDEMTATKYIVIQEEAYIRGKAEEQQKAEQIIRENYIPKQVVIDKIEEIEIIKQITSKAKYTHLELLQFAINNLEELLEK